jgi:hypothetical protein
MSHFDPVLLDLVAGALAALAGLVLLAAGLHRVGWTLLALAAPAATVAFGAVFALRAEAGAASAVIAAGGVMGVIAAAAAALTAPTTPTTTNLSQTLARIAGTAAAAAVFTALLWAGADAPDLAAPTIRPMSATALAMLAALAAASGLAIWGVLGFGERAARALPRGAASHPAHPRHHAGLRILIKGMAPAAAGFAAVTVLLAGPGFGFAGGAAAATAIGLFALLYGPASALRALPPMALAAAASVGLLVGAGAAAWANWGGASGAATLAGIGLALVVAGGFSLAILAIIGRVGDLGEGA